METEDVKIQERIAKDTVRSSVFTAFVAFSAGLYCAGFSSSLRWLLLSMAASACAVATKVRATKFEQPQTVQNGSKETSLPRPSNVRIQSDKHVSSEQASPKILSRSPSWRDVRTDIVRHQLSNLALAKHNTPYHAGTITPPPIPTRSPSALSLRGFAMASINSQLTRRDSGYVSLSENDEVIVKQAARTIDESIQLYNSGRGNELTNEEIVELCIQGTIPSHSLEKLLDNDSRAIFIRRNVLVRTAKQLVSRSSPLNLNLDLPFEDYDFSRVRGRCAENVIGYMPLPVGIAGPLNVDGESLFIPMATTEGTLIASTSRGCKGLNASGGVTTVVLADGMTRAPVVQFRNISEALKAKQYIESDAGRQVLEEAFRSTTSHGKLLSITVKMAGSYLYLRFKASTGEAMGMNIVGKGVNAALTALLSASPGLFQGMKIVSLSGNFCSDKKPSAINWIDGRGKSVVAEAIIPEHIVKSVFRCSVESLIALNTSKNYVGSALAGVSAGGFNAHAANIVTALFLATGQDPAQNVESSNCITMMEKTSDGSLQVSVSMPSIEVGTVGGGTHLAPQASMLNLLGVKNADGKGNGENASRLACIVAAAVLAGELSLCAALTTGDLIKAHMALNRKAESSTK